MLSFLLDLERAKIHFLLDRVRDEAMMVRIDVPGERWEVEFFGDGGVEVERFRTVSEGVVRDAEARQLLRDLLVKYGD